MIRAGFRKKDEDFEFYKNLDKLFTLFGCDKVIKLSNKYKKYQNSSGSGQKEIIE